MDPAHLIMLLHQHQNQLLQVQQVLNVHIGRGGVLL